MPITASTVITDIRTLGDTDSATSTLSDAQIIAAINWAHEHVYDVIVDADEGFFETVVTASLVGGSNAITPPVTTTFRRIDLVEVIDSAGERRAVVPLRSKKDKLAFSVSATITRDSDLYYYLQGNALLIEPRPTANATDALEITIVPEPTRITTSTSVLDVPDNWVKVVALRALGILDIRLRDGRNPQDMLGPIEVQLIQGLEGRQRQEPRRIIRVEEVDDYDGVYVG